MNSDCVMMKTVLTLQFRHTEDDSHRKKERNSKQMKKAMKKLVAAALAALVATSACTTLTGCKNNKDGQTAGGSGSASLSTMPGGTSASVNTGNPDQTTGTTSPLGQGGEAVNPTMKGFNVLTGEPAQRDIAYTRPVAIVVDNISNSYKNQTGLDQADVLYEALVAPGITRFLMVTADYTLLDSVCNIRSGRDYHMDFAAYHNAVLVCHGGSNTPNYDFFTLAAERYGNRWGFVDTAEEKWFYIKEYGNMYGTIDHYGDRKDLAYDIIFKPSALTALLSSGESKFAKQGNGTLLGQTKRSLHFVDYGTVKDMSGASAATEVALKFKCDGSAGVKNVSFLYDAVTGKYLRSQDGQPHTDAQTGAQLSFTNVITLFTDVDAVDTGLASDPSMTLVDTRLEGSKGYGYYFTGGRVIEIRWGSDGESLVLEEPDGSTLVMNTGNTYIGYLDDSYLSVGQFWS